MLGSAMIRNYVHDDADAFLPCLVHEGPVKLIASEAGIDVVVIRSGISMI